MSGHLCFSCFIATDETNDEQEIERNRSTPILFYSSLRILSSRIESNRIESAMTVFKISLYGLGLIFIALVAIIWSFASVVVQYLYRDQSFDAPFLLTYIGTSLFVVQIPLHRLYEHCVSKNSDGSDGYDSIPTRDEDEEGETGHIGGSNNESVRGENSTSTETPFAEIGNYNWTEKDHIIAAAKLSPFWFVSNYAYNASLQHTSITSSTVLVNTGSLFTFLIALLMREERFSCWKLLGVLFGLAGSILMGLHDAKIAGVDNGNSRMRFLFASVMDSYDDDDDDASAKDDDLKLWGDTLSVISASFYGIYTVMVRLLCPKDESLMSMQLFLGYVGLWNMVVLSPIAVYQLGIAHSVTLSAWVFGCLVVTGLFNNVLSDYLWARSVVLTSATVASVGLGLTIPFAFISDILMGIEGVLNLESIFGAGFVLSGFALVNLGQTKSDRVEENEQIRWASEGDEALQSISMETLSSENDLTVDQNAL